MILLEEAHDEHVLLLSPLHFDDLGVQMMMPSLAALFANPTWELSSDLGPVFGSFCKHNLAKESIFGFRPRSPDQLAAATQL